jgi:glutamate N-acetyltransferase/amino-acid N-acetyltransferase
MSEEQSAVEEPKVDGPRMDGPKGFVAGGVIAGIKASGNMDLGAILCDRPAVTAVVTTTNLFCSAPVILCRQRTAASPRMRGVIVNSGCANACTGDKGLKDAEAMTRAAEQAAQAQEGKFLVASTGVIGQPLPMDKITQAMPGLMASLSPTGWESFAQAIMTTDLSRKMSRRTVRLSMRSHATVLGVAKGSGMIHPNMATMLSFIVTDYPLGPSHARQLLRQVADKSFNALTVDGDTSTSDTLVLMSSGAALPRKDATDATDEKFAAAFTEVAQELTQMIARDGEGATKLITIEVAGAKDDASARQIAKSVGNSPLVKTAIFGSDPNWGRICCAAGYAGIPFDVNLFSLKLQGRQVMKAGLPIKFDRAALREALGVKDVLIQISVGAGSGSARIWTCDLTYDYIRINAEYTT